MAKNKKIYPARDIKRSLGEDVYKKHLENAKNLRFMGNNLQDLEKDDLLVISMIATYYLNKNFKNYYGMT